MIFENAKEKFNELLRATERPGTEELIKYLEATDFYTAPASTNYHNSFEGGLLCHSLRVYDLFKEKLSEYAKKHEPFPEDFITISTLLHDLCKVNLYQKVKKWRKDDKGKWEDYEVYEVKDNFPIGHGEKSVIVAQRFIKLTNAEVLLIRWHMGGFVSKDEYRTFNEACKILPEIKLLNTADIEATM